MTGFLVSIASAPIANAGPWEFSASVEGGLVLIDNLFLAPSDPKEEEAVVVFAPELRLRNEGERFNADINYRVETFYYLDQDDDTDIAHILDAETEYEVLPDRFFIEAFASAGQVVNSVEQPIVLTNVPISGNRGDFVEYGVTPTWEQRFRRFEVMASSTFRDYSLDVTGGVEPDFQIQSQFDLGNEFAEQGIIWGFHYEHERFNFKDGLPFEYQRADFSLGYWINSELQLFALGGRETALDEFLDPALDSSIWEAGFLYAPNSRMSVELAVGERGYGDAYRASLNYTGQRGEITLNYTEAPEARADIVSGIVALEPTSLEGIIDPIGTNDRFLQKRAELILLRRLSKTNIELRVFNDDRQNVVGLGGGARPDETFTGATLDVEWQAGPRLEFGVALDFLRFEDAVRDGELLRGEISTSYAIGARTNVILAVDHTANNETEGGSFDSSQVSLILRRDFGLQ